MFCKTVTATRTILLSILILSLGFFLNTAASFQEEFGSPPDVFGGPQQGDRAPDFELHSLDGKTLRLNEILQKGPVVLEFGSYTCPIFRQRHTSMERLREQYQDRVSFFTIYTLEAHPKGDICPYSGREWVTSENEAQGILFRQPLSAAERKKIALEARNSLEIQTTTLLDDMINSTWKAYGGAPAAYLIGSDGVVRLRQGWFEPKVLEKTLSELREAA